MSGDKFIGAGWRGGLGALLAVAAWLAAGETACGQEALRISLAGDLAAAAQKQAESAIGYYNLLLGPVAWRLAAGLEADYNDNVRLQRQSPQGDLIFRPNASAQMHWPVTPVNELNLTVAAGYSAYVRHRDLDQFFVNPGSGLSFNLYVGDWVVNLHDQLAITENAYQNQAANGNITYAALQNTAGVRGLWDLDRAVVTLGCDHGNYLALNSAAGGQPDAASENFYLNAGVHPAPELLSGVEAGGGWVRYSGSAVAAPDATQWNAGGFCTATVSQYVSARLDAGYTAFVPEAASTNFSGSASSGFYLQLLVTHRVNRFFNYTLSAGRSIDLQYNGQPYDRYDVRWQPNWNFLRDWQVSTPLWWEHGTEVYYQAASYDQYGAGITLGRQITRKLSGSLSVQFIKENSGQAGLSYTDGIVSLSFACQF